MIKAGQLTLKQSESFSHVVSTITGDNLGIELKQRLLRCKLEDQKLAFQHCGGSMKELADQKKAASQMLFLYMTCYWKHSIPKPEPMTTTTTIIMNPTEQTKRTKRMRPLSAGSSMRRMLLTPKVKC